MSNNVYITLACSTGMRVGTEFTPYVLRLLFFFYFFVRVCVCFFSVDSGYIFLNNIPSTVLEHIYI